MTPTCFYKEYLPQISETETHLKATHIDKPVHLLPVSETDSHQHEYKDAHRPGEKDAQTKLEVTISIVLG